MTYLRLGPLILAMLVCGCSKKPPEIPVTFVSDDDPRMNAAIATARASVKDFIAKLQAPAPTQTAFSIKHAFSDGPETEHMWITPITYDGTKFHGAVNNEPKNLKNVKLGQRVSIEPSKISDWFYVENGKLVGGFTIRVLRDAMTPAERAEFDKGVPFKMD